MFQSSIDAYTAYMLTKAVPAEHHVRTSSHEAFPEASSADGTALQHIGSNRSLSSLDSAATSHSLRRGSFNSLSSFDQSVDGCETETTTAARSSSRRTRVRAAARSFLGLDKIGKYEKERERPFSNCKKCIAGNDKIINRESLMSGWSRYLV